MYGKLGTTLNWINEDAIASSTRYSLNVGDFSSVSFQVDYADNNPSAIIAQAEAFNAGANTITTQAHGLPLGLKVQLTTDGVLPTGLTTAKDYFVIVVDEDTIQLGDTLALAVAGTAVDFDDEGSGAHTITATVSSANTLKLQKSNDGVSWTDISGATVTIATTAGSTMFDVSALPFNHISALYTPTAGSISLQVHLATRS